MAANPPPQKHHHRVRLNYITQARVRPPTFVIWANSPDAIPDSYKRYIENRFREQFKFGGAPLESTSAKNESSGKTYKPNQNGD